MLSFIHVLNIVNKAKIVFRSIIGLALIWKFKDTLYRMMNVCTFDIMQKIACDCVELLKFIELLSSCWVDACS